MKLYFGLLGKFGGREAADGFKTEIVKLRISRGSVTATKRKTGHLWRRSVIDARRKAHLEALVYIEELCSALLPRLYAL